MIIFAKCPWNDWIPYLESINCKIVDVSALTFTFTSTSKEFIIPSSIKDINFCNKLKLNRFCPTDEVADLLNNKQKFYDWMNKNNFGDYIPKLFTYPTLQYPCVCKDIIGSGGINCRVVRSNKHRINPINKIFQEFIDSTEESAIHLFAVQGVIYFITMFSAHVNPYNITHGAITNYTIKEIPKTTFEIVTAIICKLKYTGFACIDLRLIGTDHHFPKIFEINPRIGGSLVKNPDKLQEALACIQSLPPSTLHLTPYTLHLTPYTLHLPPSTFHKQVLTPV